MVKTIHVRVKAINAFGVSSTFTSATHDVVGATETPADVTDLSVSLVGSNQMELSWTPVADLDISWYEIRFQDVTSGATWNESTPLAKVVRRKSNALVVNAQIGSFCIKAVDKLGNSSANASIVSTNISGLQNFVTNKLLVNNGKFLGTRGTGVALSRDNANRLVLILDTITNVDSLVGNIDSPEGLFDLGGTNQSTNPTNFNGNIVSQELMTFSNTLSLDAIYDVSLGAILGMSSEDEYDLFDSGRGASLFEDAKAPFDGSSEIQCGAEIQVGADDSDLANITNFRKK